MRNRYSIVALCLGITLAASAQVSCLVSFASLSPEEQRIERLAMETYVKLWEQLGRKADEKTVKAILDNGDPFHVPENALALSQLRKNLGEFRKLLEQSSGNSETVRAQFLESLRGRLASTESARQTRQVAIAKVWPEMKFKYAQDFDTYSVSEDSNWLAFTSPPHEKTRLVIANLLTNTTAEYQAPPELNVANPRYAPDGRGIFISRPNLQLEYIPLNNGVPDFTARSMIGDSVATFQFRVVIDHATSFCVVLPMIILL